jgi:hypothetical protein
MSDTVEEVSKVTIAAQTKGRQWNGLWVVTEGSLPLQTLNDRFLSLRKTEKEKLGKQKRP